MFQSNNPTNQTKKPTQDRHVFLPQVVDGHGTRAASSALFVVPLEVGEKVFFVGKKKYKFQGWKFF